MCILETDLKHGFEKDVALCREAARLAGLGTERELWLPPPPRPYRLAERSLDSLWKKETARLQGWGFEGRECTQVIALDHSLSLALFGSRLS